VEILRWERNPWGQQVLRGLGWDTLYVAAAVGVIFMMAHALYQWKRPAQINGEEDLARLMQMYEGVPERVVRHPLASRIFHWAMAAAMFALLLTGFLPILGVQFSWVTAHWISGIVLTGLVLFHIAHSTWMGLDTMWISRREIQDACNQVRRLLGKEVPEPGKPGKYPLENKLFHHATALFSLGVIGTGLLMMVRVDTPFWVRNPYLLPDATWGVIYVIHGVSAVAFVTMIMAHIYFAARPEKRWITWSMIRGWISRRHYLQHHDPELWRVEPEGPRARRKVSRPGAGPVSRPRTAGGRKPQSGRT